jgi:hypothetical protein
MHDAHELRETPFWRLSMLLGSHRTSMPGSLAGNDPVSVLVASVGRTRAHNRQYRGPFLRPTEGVLISGGTKASGPGAVLTQTQYTSQRPDTGSAN